MTLLDWLVIAAYILSVILIGLYFSRRASQSAEDYLVAGRSLPWWVIGFSDVASSAGADAFWVLVIFSGAFVGLGRFFWISAIISLPLGVLWARYWRRLALVSPGQIFETRYGGLAAGRFRGFFVLYGALFSSAMILGYVLQGFAQIMAPFLGWPPDVVLAAFAGLSMLYTMVGGLFGVAYSDVTQFVLLMAGRILFAIVLLGVVGGFDAMVDGVIAARGAEFLQPYPPSGLEIFGEWKVENMTLLALMMAGGFGVASTQSASVQRSLAARSEADAAWGQMFNAVLTLVVRLAPLVIIGFCAITLYPNAEDAGSVWAELVKSHAGPGLLGLILVGVVAGYMSTIDTFINFMTAGLFNDFYRRHIRKDASPREQVWFCRFATCAVTLIALLWAKVLIGTVDGAWLNFMNSVVGLFMLPVALLRWLWWRLNIWGEIVAFVGGVPLAYLLWFVLGFKDEPYWLSFLVLFFSGWIAIITATLLTRPEEMGTLTAFYEKVRPPGWWGPVRDASAFDHTQNQMEWKMDLAAAGAGVVFCACLTICLGSIFARSWALLCFTTLLLGVSGAFFARWTMAATRARKQAEQMP